MSVSPLPPAVPPAGPPPSRRPSRKVAAGGIGGAVSILVVWGLALASVKVPAAVASAITTLASFGAGFFTPQ